MLQEILKNDLSQIAENIEAKGEAAKKSSKKSDGNQTDDIDNQMSFFSTLSDKDILDEIRTLDISSMTPIDALNQLDAIQKKVKNRW